MVRVSIVSAYPEGPSNPTAKFMREHFPLGGKWKLVGGEEKPELILFAEAHPPGDPLFFRVLFSKLRRKYSGIAFLYHDADFAAAIMPGVYPSLRFSHFKPTRFRGACYIAQIERNAYISDSVNRERFLASFVGANTHPIRSRIQQLLKSDSRFNIQDTTGRKAWELPLNERDAYHRNYALLISESAFVLCPRGVGPSTYRLFEAMEAGRCPVIISDEWTPPLGPDWTVCSLRIAEADIHLIPKILETRRVEAAALGARAKEAWMQWFSPQTATNTILAQCYAMLPTPARYPWLRMLNHSTCRYTCRSIKHQMRYFLSLMKPKGTT